MAAPVPAPPGPEVARVEDRTIPGPAGEIPVRIYTPSGVGPFPALAWYHGGGWVVGDLDTADATARHLCVKADCVVVSVDYRLAPETKFPGAADDCYAATQWLANNAASLNVDATLIAVGGDSAGGNLAAAVSLMSRDRGGCDIVFQLLVYPVTERNFNTGSYIDNAGRLPAEPRRDDLVLGPLPGQRRRRHQSLCRAHVRQRPEAAPAPGPGNHRRVRPAPRRGRSLRRKAAQPPRVPTVCTRYDGMIHGFYGMPAAVDKSREAVEQSAACLREAFAAAPVGGVAAEKVPSLP